MDLKSQFERKFIVLSIIFSFFLITNFAQAQLLQNGYNYELLAKAQPDEDFFGIGNSNNNYDPLLTTFNGTPKVNQAYVWGLTRAGDDGNQIWFGTAPNVHCMVMGGYLGSETAHETNCWACEFGQTQYVNPVIALSGSSIPGAIGDWRPSRIFMYDLNAKQLVEKTPSVLQTPLLNLTLGLRSAGANNGVVFLGGPSLTGGINLFAFNSNTGEFIGAKNLPVVSPDPKSPGNIRKWLVVNNYLYVGVGAGELALGGVGDGSAPGQIWKWIGDVSDPFQFEVVGNVTGSVAELAEHQGRIFISTWGGPTGVWMSPMVPVNGLTSANKDQWKKVWDINNYEVDQITALTTGGGALASYGGYLYWGTMHVPMMSAGVHMQYFPTSDPVEIAETVLGTYRAISIFRGKNFGEANQQVDLLYGQEYLPSFDPINGWTIKQNNMTNKKPLFGLSGFGNFMNNYTWTMQVYKNKLYVGTMDWSFLVGDGIASLLGVDLNPAQIQNVNQMIPQDFYNQNYDLSQIPLLANLNSDLSNFDMSILNQLQAYLPQNSNIIPPLNFGADLWYFDSASDPAKPLSVNGVGNPTSYGIRTMVASDKDLFLGMANPMNLCDKGGWELIKIDDEQNTNANTGGVTDVAENNSSNQFYLNNNYPNPFNPSTTIQFNLPKDSDVRVEIYNSLGQVVDILVDGHLSSGLHQYSWDASNMSSGMYFYKIKAGSNVQIKKMTLMK